MLPVLLLPVIGLWFVGQMAEITRLERSQSIDNAARSFAATLHERTDLLGRGASDFQLPANAQSLPVGLIARATVDGLDQEWLGAEGREIETSVLPGVPLSTLRVTVTVARSQEQAGELFLLVRARDERFVRPLPASASRTGKSLLGDQLRVLTGPAPNRMFELSAPMHGTVDGWLGEMRLDPDTRFVRVEVVDVDYQASRKLEATARSPIFGLTSPTLEDDGWHQLQVAERRSRWAEALRGLVRAGMRVAVYDPAGRLLAREGSLGENEVMHESLVDTLAARLLSMVVGLSAGLNTDGQETSPLSSALTGVPAHQSLRLPADNGGSYWLTSSAHPVWNNDQIVGALVLEQSHSSDLSSGQNALQWLALLAALAIIATVLALFGLSSLTVARIEKLRRSADAAIDARGRVIGGIPRFRWHDEVGSLAAGYERVLDRLREHQHYLGNLRARLVHELRTPIMVVRSSLENLQDIQTAQTGQGGASYDPPSPENAFVQRALGGTVRLERIVSSMSEAASLESMLADSQLEKVDLATLLRSLAQSYELAYQDEAATSPAGSPESRFAVVLAPEFLNGRPALAMVVPETIAQALDKLVSNAVDYAKPGTVIQLQLGVVPAGGNGPIKDGISLSVKNEGPPLPEQMAGSLFESMVSVRGEAAGDQSHLGLGLYLVRLIAEFHGGWAFAENVSNGVRVGFVVSSENTEPVTE